MHHLDVALANFKLVQLLGQYSFPEHEVADSLLLHFEVLHVLLGGDLVAVVQALLDLARQGVKDRGPCGDLVFEEALHLSEDKLHLEDLVEAFVVLGRVLAVQNYRHQLVLE